MQIIHTGFWKAPHVALVSVAAPMVLGAFFPPIENGLVHSLVVGPSEREVIFGPNHERRPVAARRLKAPLQGVQLRGRHANINRAVGYLENVPAGDFQKDREILAQVVVQDLAAVRLILNVVWKVCEAQSGPLGPH